MLPTSSDEFIATAAPNVNGSMVVVHNLKGKETSLRVLCNGQFFRYTSPINAKINFLFHQPKRRMTDKKGVFR